MMRWLIDPLKPLALICTGSVLSVLVVDAPSHAVVLYQNDSLDSTGENRLFPVGLQPTQPDYTGQIVGDLMWLNTYTVQTGGEVLDSISLTFGGQPQTDGSAPSGLADWQTNPYPVTALLYGDPNNDGNPIDAQLLAQADGIVQNPDTLQLTTFNIAPTELAVGQNFFVGALFRNLERDQRPATADLRSADPAASTAARSWFAIGNHGDGQPSNIDINDLSNNFVPGNGGQSPVPLPSIYGSWVLRATGQSARRRVPEPTLILGLAATAGLAYRWRKRR
ncbi:PEP-CTERM sorting domain-containing protein [filamentous cyanobacterium LEGE 11480]|uniref:PEP-CTERM sorting domain-containing protein n=1 Tax=Romeriopsis navalis LEGE 11480 TaxID=2777977 RepID=A0A928Z486_9CYAN|nr:PEP-CTERM sorting domain-containing protein [Romeriopsis navalis]MBE9032326.1 PEP-CTERM sorting domain-containing protein [Romeriopsis navalis LEGE 11480]